MARKAEKVYTPHEIVSPEVANAVANAAAMVLSMPLRANPVGAAVTLGTPLVARAMPYVTRAIPTLAKWAGLGTAAYGVANTAKRWFDADEGAEAGTAEPAAAPAPAATGTTTTTTTATPPAPEPEPEKKPEESEEKPKGPEEKPAEKPGESTEKPNTDSNSSSNNTSTKEEKPGRGTRLWNWMKANKVKTGAIVASPFLGRLGYGAFFEGGLKDANTYKNAVDFELFVPKGIVTRAINGDPNYYAKKDSTSTTSSSSSSSSTQQNNNNQQSSAISNMEKIASAWAKIDSLNNIENNNNK